MRPRRQFDTGVDAGSNDAALKSAEPGRLGRVRVRSLAARAAAGFLVALAALLALPMQAQAQTTVTISADKTSAVFRVDPITYTLTRTGSMTDALPVTVLLTQSEDFLKASELTKTVTIGAGKSTETFTVAASSFQHFEVGTKVEGGTLTAAVQNDADYDLGMMASVEVNFFIGVMIQFEMASYSVGEATGPLAVKVIARTGPHAGQPPVAAATYADQVYELVTAEGNCVSAPMPTTVTFSRWSTCLDRRPSLLRAGGRPRRNELRPVADSSDSGASTPERGSSQEPNRRPTWRSRRAPLGVPRRTGSRSWPCRGGRTYLDRYPITYDGTVSKTVHQRQRRHECPGRAESGRPNGRPDSARTKVEVRHADRGGAEPTQTTDQLNFFIGVMIPWRPTAWARRPGPSRSR